MSWSLDIERSYLISGSVSGSGQLDLTYEVDSASLNFQGLMAQSFDCVFISAQRSFVLDISGDSEQVRLSGVYDPDAGTFSPKITHIGGKSWLDAALHGIALNQTHDFDESTIQLAPHFKVPVQPSRCLRHTTNTWPRTASRCRQRCRQAQNRSNQRSSRCAFRRQPSTCVMCQSTRKWKWKLIGEVSRQAASTSPTGRSRRLSRAATW